MRQSGEKRREDGGRKLVRKQVSSHQLSVITINKGMRYRFSHLTPPIVTDACLYIDPPLRLCRGSAGVGSGEQKDHGSYLLGGPSTEPLDIYLRAQTALGNAYVAIPACFVHSNPGMVSSTTHIHVPISQMHRFPHCFMTHSFTTLKRPLGSRPTTLFRIPFPSLCPPACPPACPPSCRGASLRRPLFISSCPVLTTCSCAAMVSGEALNRRSTLLLTVPRRVSPTPCGVYILVCCWDRTILGKGSS